MTQTSAHESPAAQAADPTPSADPQLDAQAASGGDALEQALKAAQDELEALKADHPSGALATQVAATTTRPSGCSRQTGARCQPLVSRQGRRVGAATEPASGHSERT